MKEHANAQNFMEQQNYTSVDPKQFIPTKTQPHMKGAKTTWKPKEGSDPNQQHQGVQVYGCINKNPNSKRFGEQEKGVNQSHFMISNLKAKSIGTTSSIIRLKIENAKGLSSKSWKKKLNSCDSPDRKWYFYIFQV